jgi:hypothetical protein
MTQVITIVPFGDAGYICSRVDFHRKNMSRLLFIQFKKKELGRMSQSNTGSLSVDLSYQEKSKSTIQ